MNRPTRSMRVAAVSATLLTFCMTPSAPCESAVPPAPALRAVLLSADDVVPKRLERARADKMNAVVLQLTSASDSDRSFEKAAAISIQASGLRLFYWIEIGRDPTLARMHPEWMASLQGHTEWRRLFPEFPQPREGQVVKTFPWVPVLYREAFAAHLLRVERFLKEMPGARGVFLNDLQAAPSACGCGNHFCRWTADYGPIKTATPLGPDAAARFIEMIGKLAPESEIIPVWTTECEEHDGSHDGLCAGVGCFKGICWRAFTEQLSLVERKAGRVGVLLPYRDFRRDDPRYGAEAGWILHALRSFQAMPPNHGGKAIQPARLVAILQGWDVTAEQMAAQIQRSREAGAGGYVLSEVKIDQSWSPMLVDRARD